MSRNFLRFRRSVHWPLELTAELVQGPLSKHSDESYGDKIDKNYLFTPYILDALSRSTCKGYCVLSGADPLSSMWCRHGHAPAAPRSGSVRSWALHHDPQGLGPQQGQRRAVPDGGRQPPRRTKGEKGVFIYLFMHARGVPCYCGSGA